MTFFHINAALLFSLPDSPGGCSALGVSRVVSGDTGGLLAALPALLGGGCVGDVTVPGGWVPCGSGEDECQS